MKVNGPFFVKEGDQYKLAPICEECSFGNSAGCLLKPCVYFDYLVDEEKEEEE